ncbi:hypothetical protein [Lunatibacter salilacus]|uniref:hypothetical protein n=1 Tax=Lunatibacter salilacus TaxID=2483804 RepID=UPI0018FE07BE|nr:hypothetical protein [Lunatibacter salilacus]
MVPEPVAKAVLDALIDVEVTNSASSDSGFQLSFAFSSKSPLNALLLLLAKVGPLIRVIILVNIKGRQHVLIDGVISTHQLSPNVQTGQSILTVNGFDLTTVMNLKPFTGIPYPDMPAEARVAQIIEKYAEFGIVSNVIDSVFKDMPIRSNRIPIHQGTDLDYVKLLARDVGHVFYLEPGPSPGSSTAYWGPELKVGPPQPALNINMDIHTNIESLNFTFNGDSKEIPVVYIQNEETNESDSITIPVSDINSLNPPLGSIPPFASRFPKIRNTAHLKPVQAKALGLAEASRTADALTGSGTLNVLRYGQVLKARALVGVRGACEAFNGLYYVKSVTHKIKRGEYKQDFTLSRNGLVSTEKRVLV